MHDTAEWYYRQALASVRYGGFAALAVDGLSGLADALTRRANRSADAGDRYACLEQARDLEACGDAGDAQTLRLRAESLPRAAARLAA